MLAISLLLACPKTGEGPESLSELAPAESLENIDARGKAEVEARPLAEAETLTLRGATVMTAAGEVHEPGWLILEGGRITALGAGEPSETAGTVIDLEGYFITPGLIDTHSHMGVYPSPSAGAHGDGNEASSPVTAGVWAEHSFWPQDPKLETAVAGGITTIQVLPGSANLIGGRGVTLHMVPTVGSRAMRFPGAPDGLKMACGENPKRVYGKNKGGAPSTRMGNLRGQREAFAQAQDFIEQWQAYEDDYEDWVATQEGEEPKPPGRDLKLETLAGAMQGDILVHVHCYRADDMLSILQLGEEFGFEVRSFHHALEAYKIGDELAEGPIGVSTWADWWGFKMEAYDGIPYNLGMVEDAGAMAIVHSDSAIDIQRLNQEAAKALRYARESGLEISDDSALRWVTWNPAWALGVQDEVGSLEAGKRADLVVWTGHPFSVYSHAERVYVDGVLRYDRKRPPETPWSDFELGQDLEVLR